VIENARALADTLVKHGYKLQTNGTDNHLVLWDLRPLGLTGSKLEKLCDMLGITINSQSSPVCALTNQALNLLTENAVAGDTSAQVPGGIRLGTSALTSRNMLESDVRTVGDFLHRAVQIALGLQKEAGSKLLKDFVAAAGKGEGAVQIKTLRKDVSTFARQWPLPGVDVSTLTRPAGIHEDD
jgi:glycine hydroxymethyltransferase